MEKEVKDSPSYQSPEFQFLGKKAIEICQQNNLDEKGIKIVDEILTEWSSLISKAGEKIKVFKEKTKNYPDLLGIIQGLTEISLLWLEENPRSPVGKFARKAPEN